MDTFLRNRQRMNDTGIIPLLELTLKSGGEIVRLAGDTEDCISNGLTYTAMPFAFSLPSSSSGETPKTTITIDNTGRGISQAMEEFVPGDVVKIRLMVVDRKDVNTVKISIPLPIQNVSINITTATADAGWGTILDQRSVLVVANPFTAPGLF